jgi:uncharacterized membrane protein
VLYLLHPSDPVLWWSPDLILREPDWISQPPGRDVLSAMFWVPFVTFWLVTADLPFAASAPAGHGHVYTTEFVGRMECRPAADRHHSRRAGHPQGDNRERRINPGRPPPQAPAKSRLTGDELFVPACIRR